jgi:hypothetical protein
LRRLSLLPCAVLAAFIGCSSDSPSRPETAGTGGTSSGSGGGSATVIVSDASPTADRSTAGTGGASPSVDGDRPTDAGVGTSGPDVGSAGGGSESGSASGCSPGATPISDDFESGALTKWQLTDPFGNPLQAGNTQYSVTVDTTRAHSGTHSVKVHNGGLFGVAPPGPEFYGRAFMWLGSTPGTIPSGGHWGSIIGAGTGPTGAVEVRMGGQFGILIYNYSTNDDVILSAPNFFNGGMDAGTSPMVGAWMCVEFFFGKDALRTWINGAEIATLDVTPATTWDHGMKAPWSPAYTAVRLGYANYNANAIDVWYDDVAIGTQRLCCP